MVPFRPTLATHTENRWRFVAEPLHKSEDKMDSSPTWKRISDE